MRKHISKGTYQNNNSHLEVIEDEYANDNYRNIRTQSDEAMHAALVNSIDQTDAKTSIKAKHTSAGGGGGTKDSINASAESSPAYLNRR